MVTAAATPWYKLGLEMSNAWSLGIKYGVGPARSGAEVAAWGKEIRKHVSPEDACVLSAWFGGAGEEDAQIGLLDALLVIANPVLEAIHAAESQLTKARSAAEVCRQQGLRPAPVADALDRLYKKNPLLGTLVYVKANAKAARTRQQDDVQASQDLRELDKVVHEVVATFKAGSSDAVGAAGDVVENAVQAVGEVIKKGPAFLRAAIETSVAIQTSFWRAIFGAVPTSVWIGLGVSAIAVVLWLLLPFLRPLLAARQLRGTP